MAEANREALVDSSALIAHLRGRLPLQELTQEYDSIYISVVTLYEIEYGAVRAGRTSDFERIQSILSPMVLPLEAEDAEMAAFLNGSLARRNRRIGPADALIAGTAVRYGLTVLTLNTDEFRRIPNLVVVDPSQA